jgi:hypothetical protein
MPLVEKRNRGEREGKEEKEGKEREKRVKKERRKGGKKSFPSLSFLH